MEKLLNVIHTETEKLRSLAYELRGLSKSFEDVGNDVMAQRCRDISNEIFTSQSKMNEALGLELKEQIDKNYQTSATILKAALAGAQIERISNSKKE